MHHINKRWFYGRIFLFNWEIDWYVYTIHVNVCCNDLTEAELTALHWFGLRDGLHGQDSPISHLHERQLLPAVLPAHQQ